MSIRNCSRCGKIFNYVAGKPICQNCRKTLEEAFKVTRTYIKRNPNSSIAEVSEACEVDVKQIKQWVREERLAFSKDSAIGIDCEVCGKTIKTGRFCDECKGQMTNELGSVYKAPEEDKPKVNPFAQKNSAKMRFMDGKNKR